MLIGQQVLVVEVVEEDAHHQPVMRVEYQNHVAAALNLVDALSAKGGHCVSPWPPHFCGLFLKVLSAQNQI